MWETNVCIKRTDSKVCTEKWIFNTEYWISLFDLLFIHLIDWRQNPVMRALFALFVQSSGRVEDCQSPLRNSRFGGLLFLVLFIVDPIRSDKSPGIDSLVLLSTAHRLSANLLSRVQLLSDCCPSQPGTNWYQRMPSPLIAGHVIHNFPGANPQGVKAHQPIS